MRRNAQLLRHFLNLEDEVLAENPGLAQAVHSLNLQEILAQQQGSRGALQGESDPKNKSVWSKFFPGLGES